MYNATYLFEKPSRKFKNSESRWTAIAQISLFYLSREKPNQELPIYSSDENGFLSKTGSLLISGFNFSNTVCEQRLKGDVFGIDVFAMKYDSICPDMMKIDHQERQVILFEVKTLSASVSRNVKLYSELADYLRKNKWNCDLFYLLSHGHEKERDWSELSENKSRIIIWEDLFSLMADTPIAYLLGESLKLYCDPPAQRG